MSKEEKEKFIKKHFSRECRIILPDIQKSILYKNLKAGVKTQLKSNLGRKKHSCYICFDKFFTKDELEEHKFVHYGEKDNNTFSDDDENDVITDETTCLRETRSSKKEEHDEKISADDDKNENINEVCPAEAAHPENKDTGMSSSESKANQNSNQIETNYKCLNCNVYFTDQVDIKPHNHIQYTCKYLCKMCDRQFNTKGGFVVHVLQHTSKVSNLSYKCNKCSFSFDDCYKLKRHYMSAHNIVSVSTVPNAESSVKTISDQPSSTAIVKEQTSENLHNITSTDKLKLYRIPGITKTDKPIVNSATGSISVSDKSKGNPVVASTPAPKIKRTGEGFPIFDCDVCYDVFASAKTLMRHKALHKELESTSNSSKSILIEDDEVQVVQKDDSSDKHQVVSNFSAQISKVPGPSARPMTQITPILPKLSPISPQNTDQSQKLGDYFDKNAVTSDITQMLSGNKCWPKLPIPRLTSVSQPRSVFIPHTSILKNELTSQSNKPLQTTIKDQSSKPTETSLPVSSPQIISEGGQPQLMYVLCPQGNTSTGLTSGLMMINPNSSSTMTSPSSSIVLTTSKETNTQNNTVLPTSGQNQFIINQQINTGGVVINPPTGGVQGNNFVLNQHVAGQAVNQPNTPILQSVTLPGSDKRQMYFILMPTNELSKPNTEPPPLLKSSSLEQKTTQPITVNKQPPSKKASVSSPLCKDISKALIKQLRSTPKTLKEGAKSLKKQKNEVTYQIVEPKSSQASSGHPEPIVMPIITSVGTSEEKLNSPVDQTKDDLSMRGLPTLTDPGTSEENSNSPINETEDSLEGPKTDEDCQIVMPIITSIGTVAEDSTNKKEKIRKDPASKYESEFAKFLKKSDSDVKLMTDTTKRLLRKSEVKILSPAPEASETLPIYFQAPSVSNDDIIFLDDNSSSSDAEIITNSDTATENVATSSETVNTQQVKPKIFVKKLSDLVDSPQVDPAQLTSQQLPKSAVFKHCCLRCNLQLKNWMDLRRHLKVEHQLYACKFYGCSILNDPHSYQVHLKNSHLCNLCYTHYCTLSVHLPFCEKNRKCIQVLRSERHQEVLSTESADLNIPQPSSGQSSEVRDIFAETGTDINL